MSEILDHVVGAIRRSELAFCRYITANDTGETGSHQSGFYIPKYASGLLFDSPGEKGANKDRTVVIRWQNAFETQSRFIYYGSGTRNEYRITRFGRNFPFLTDDYIGSLLVLAKEDHENYCGFVLSEDDDIESLFSIFDYSPENPGLIKVKDDTDPIIPYLMSAVSGLSDFPPTEIMAREAQNAILFAMKISDSDIYAHPDDVILQWLGAEFTFFRLLEDKVYAPVIARPFKDCQTLIDFSNSILNRRKSRAGKSLEHHLSRIFDVSGLKYGTQVVTEDNKKPDFIFPGSEQYHDFTFPADKLVFLGAKRTCKDRWRQVLNEADRIDRKYLFTLQQGVSPNQLKEMRHENLTLVVPESYKACFSKEYREDIMSLKNFINMVRSIQN